MAHLVRRRAGDGRGVIVLHGGNILGGESAWYYSGRYTNDQSGFEGSMILTHYGKPTSKSVGAHMPDQSPVDLRIVGQWIDDNTIAARAEPINGSPHMEFQMRQRVSTGPVIL